MELKLLEVTAENKHILLNLLQAYEAEFSTITKKEPDESGVYPLDTSLDSKHTGYLFFIDGLVAGFAIVGEESQRHDIAEFYIIPTRRGQSLGCQFARAVFDLYQGEWQVRQIERADKARDFWRKAIDQYTHGVYEESQDMDPYWGKVTRQTFKKA